MTNKELQNNMTELLKELDNPIISNKAVLYKQVIAKAVQLGMIYQEEMIKNGIDIIFEQLHKK